MSRRSRCLKPGCHALIAGDQLACRPHWYELPRTLRRRAWRALGMVDRRARRKAQAAVFVDAVTSWRELEASA